MKRIYVAGKLNDDAVGYIQNCHKMIRAAKKVREAGYNIIKYKSFCTRFLEFIFGK